MNWKQARRTFEPTRVPGVGDAANIVPFRNHDLTKSTQERVAELNLELALIRERIEQHERDIKALERLKVLKADSLEIYTRALAREMGRG